MGCVNLHLHHKHKHLPHKHPSPTPNLIIVLAVGAALLSLVICVFVIVLLYLWDVPTTTTKKHPPCSPIPSQSHRLRKFFLRVRGRGHVWRVMLLGWQNRAMLIVPESMAHALLRCTTYFPFLKPFRAS